MRAATVPAKIYVDDAMNASRSVLVGMSMDAIAGNLFAYPVDDGGAPCRMDATRPRSMDRST